MINNSLSVSPLYLLFKDHKNWSWALGTVPPTRPVAAGNRGQNQHMSEVVSDFVEPVVDSFEGGLEIISTEDMLARLDEINKRLEDWTPYSWWEGLTDGDFTACSNCIGEDEFEFSVQKPELCR